MEVIIRVRGDRMSFVLGLVQIGKLRGFACSKDDASNYFIAFYFCHSSSVVMLDVMRFSCQSDFFNDFTSG